MAQGSLDHASHRMLCESFKKQPPDNRELPALLAKVAWLVESLQGGSKVIQSQKRAGAVTRVANLSERALAL